jgi:hypothetical protein
MIPDLIGSRGRLGCAGRLGMVIDVRQSRRWGNAYAALTSRPTAVRLLDATMQGTLLMDP